LKYIIARSGYSVKLYEMDAGVPFKPITYVKHSTVGCLAVFPSQSFKLNLKKKIILRVIDI